MGQGLEEEAAKAAAKAYWAWGLTIFSLAMAVIWRQSLVPLPTGPGAG